jgi:hypothetical protein
VILPVRRIRTPIKVKHGAQHGRSSRRDISQQAIDDEINTHLSKELMIYKGFKKE